jgi:hypothetical protein
MVICPTLTTRAAAVFGFVSVLDQYAVTTAIGFHLPGCCRSASRSVRVLNPIYFMLIRLRHARGVRALALGIGAVCGPLLHLVSSEWGLLATADRRHARLRHRRKAAPMTTIFRSGC